MHIIVVPIRGDFFHSKAAFAPNAPLTSELWERNGLEQVRMRASSQEQECQLCVVLLPRHQPVGFDVTLPGLNALVNQFVRAVLEGQSACSSEQSDCFI